MKKFAAIGMFDGVHLGHRFLWQHISSMAKIHGGKTLAVTFTHHPLDVIAPGQAPALLTPLEKRINLLKLTGADEVAVIDFNESVRMMPAAEFVSMLRDHYGVTDLVMGFNNRIGSDRIGDQEGFKKLFNATGVTVHIADECQQRTSDGLPLSSSAVREALLQGNVKAAADILGGPYSLYGTVTHGRRIGHELGFPTANIDVTGSNMLIPKNGVYAVNVQFSDGIPRRGMLNIGTRPTIGDNDSRTSIEVHILDFDGDLYGKSLQIDFIDRLRDERRFDSLETLSSQLKADASAARSV